MNFIIQVLVLDCSYYIFSQYDCCVTEKRCTKYILQGRIVHLCIVFAGKIMDAILYTMIAVVLEFHRRVQRAHLRSIY